MAVQLYTVDEAAERLNTTVRFVRRLIAERRIAFTRLGRLVRIEADVLDAYIAAGRVQPTIPPPREPSTEPPAKPSETDGPSSGLEE